jgi:hypothetical protein
MPINNIVGNCSGLAMGEAFERIVRNHIPNENLIGVRNYFARDTANRVNKLDKSKLIGGVPTIQVPFTNARKTQIEEYIASSIIVHCSDGWNYLSRSVESLINGDIASAIHFAYYAELRSAMSIMAFEGIGVFDRQHIWFDAQRSPTLFGNFSTHGLADDGMQAWANLATKKEILFDLIKVNGRTLGEWIRETGSSTSSKYVNSIINTWLKKWSIDLHLKKDQGIRNEMSYRPHFSNKGVAIETVLDKLEHIWNLIEPSSSNGFPILDQHLLRIALEEVYKKSKGRQPIGHDYETYIQSVFGRIGESTTQPLFSFLLRRANPSDSLIFEEAKKDSGNVGINRDDPFPLICRAILLLRISAGAANSLINKSTLNKNDLRFWWENISFNQGITATLSSGIDPIDLFADIRDSLDELSTNYRSLSNVRTSFQLIPDSLLCIKQFQRAGIWGITTY